MMAEAPQKITNEMNLLKSMAEYILKYNNEWK